jgi:hypothetical protein
MIETGLVYIYSVSPARAFKGCGALIEGGYVATCRHVWRIAAPAGQPPEVEPEVEIEFPFGTKEKVGGGDKYVAPARRARLADPCEVLDGTAPERGRDPSSRSLRRPGNDDSQISYGAAGRGCPGGKKGHRSRQLAADPR